MERIVRVILMGFKWVSSLIGNRFSREPGRDDSPFALEGFQYPFINGLMDLLGGHIPGWEIDVTRREEGSCASYISKTGQGGHTVELLGLIKASVRTFPSPREDNFWIPRFEAVGLTGAVEIELDPIGDGTAKRSPLDSILIPGDELRASLID